LLEKGDIGAVHYDVGTGFGPFDLQFCLMREMNTHAQSLFSGLRDNLSDDLLELGIVILLGQSEAYRQIVRAYDDSIEAGLGQNPV
jgi:hypothetical protein